MSQTNEPTLVPELVLPPGKDGKAHPGYKLLQCGDFDDPYHLFWYTTDTGDIERINPNGIISLPAAKAIAWDWQESPHFRNNKLRETQIMGWRAATQETETLIYRKLPIILFNPTINQNNNPDNYGPTKHYPTN